MASAVAGLMPTSPAPTTAATSWPAPKPPIACPTNGALDSTCAGTPSEDVVAAGFRTKSNATIIIKNTIAPIRSIFWEEFTVELLAPLFFFRANLNVLFFHHLLTFSFTKIYKTAKINESMVTATNQERFRTLKGVFDEFTNRTLFKLQSQGVFDELESPLEVGKESNVFIASKGKEKVIVKIYRVQNADFKRMFEYIGKDPRYDNLRKRRREIIFAWAQREYKNLLRAEKFNVTVPKPLGWKFHILVEEMIGSPALPLKDDHPKNPKKFLKEIIKEMKTLYNAGLIHGDLSSFNILNDNQKPVLIDFSQTTLVRTPNSEELLERDVRNIARFFGKLSVDVQEEDMLKRITNKELPIT